VVRASTIGVIGTAAQGFSVALSADGNTAILGGPDVGRDGEFVLVSVLGAGEARRDGGFHLTKVQPIRGGGFGGAFSAPRFGLGKLLARDRWPLWSAPTSRGGRILCTETC
jgi:hypothetical protein